MRQIMEMRVDPRLLAIARVGVGVAVVITAWETYDLLMRIAHGRVAMPVLDWLPAPTGLSATIVLALGALFGLALTVGYRSNLAAIGSALTTGCVLLFDQQMYSSHRMLITLLCCYLALSGAGAAWSMDSRFRGGRCLTVQYWPQLLMMAQVSALYLFAGLSKINPIFLAGHVLRSHIWWPLPTWTFPVLAIMTVVVELALAIGLWLPRLRVPAVVLGLGLHASIVLMLREPLVLVAFAFACMAVYPMFLRRPSTRNRQSREHEEPVVGGLRSPTAQARSVFSPAGS